MECVAGNPQFSQPGSERPESLFTVVSPAGLVIAQHPFLRQRHAAGQISIICENFRHGIPADEIVVQIAVIASETVIPVIFLAEIEIAFKSVVIKNTVDAFFL